MKDLLVSVLQMLILIICVLVCVAFFTLLERKILGYIHIRKGPNKLGILGILQPFSDAVKLFTKEQLFPSKSNIIIFYIAPIMNLFLSLFLWIVYPFITVNFSFSFAFLFVLAVSSLGVYSIMLAGWSSNSNYSMLGSIRCIAQVISYEVSFILILLSFLFMVSSFNMINFMKYQEFVWFMFLFFPLSLMIFISLLAETNRAPFDFSEGESELVSGFNTEYGSGGFAMIFLAEYGSILFMGILLSIVLLGANLFSISFYFKLGLMVILWIWVRGAMPRYRYDKLMYLAWKGYLPVSLFYLLMSFALMILMFIEIM
uniref:NADH-ubiquinone oxidoreductase chain 1 n=1 Tax=Trypodendron domesticum TaxID=1220309 RepID=A0A343A6E4_9CUCU|nr:NADH dehydrogenase subunit 1 [Trypodendron domesticum]AOY40123.1 NADH dehydrogenase subunit 1 [Trypodendron domesticum]